MQAKMSKQTFEELTQLVISWGAARGIVLKTPEQSRAQFEKTFEEAQEVLEAVEAVEEFNHACDSNYSECLADLKKEVGDVLVTLIIGATCADIDVVECLSLAYEKIKNRKGKLINGVFVKEEDL